MRAKTIQFKWKISCWHAANCISWVCVRVCVHALIMTVIMCYSWCIPLYCRNQIFLNHSRLLLSQQMEVGTCESRSDFVKKCVEMVHNLLHEPLDQLDVIVKIKLTVLCRYMLTFSSHSKICQCYSRESPFLDKWNATIYVHVMTIVSRNIQTKFGFSQNEVYL